MVFVVRGRHAVDVGEGVAFVTQTTGDQFGRGSHDLTREHLARLYQQQRLDLVFRNLQVTAELDRLDAVFFAFVDVDRDVHVLLVRRDRDLGRGDIHVDIAAIEVVRTQTLKVTQQLFTGVLVIILEERQPVAGLELEQVGQVLVGEDRVAHHVDMLNGGNGAFIDVDFQAHAVARLWNDLGVNLGRVTALGNVLALQLVTHTLKGRTLENFTLGQTGLFQPLHQVFGGDGLVAFDFDTCNRRTLDDVDDEYVAIATQLDILKETGFEQRTGSIDQTTIVRLLAYVQRQRTKDTAGGYPLEAVDTNIGDGEGLGVNFSDHQCGKNRS
ncbi:Unknown protein sequence [Pseudomonas amygdali pv. mellea]|nr:Unknown protein sequence [Pseudomonas amygdali pv. mellea]